MWLWKADVVRSSSHSQQNKDGNSRKFERQAAFTVVDSSYILAFLLTMFLLLGWWNSSLSLVFLEHHFANRLSPKEPILLLWDDFSGHWTDAVRQYAASINVILLRVPRRATSVCQPADVAWNHPFKSHLRRCWLDDMQAQIEQHRGREERFKLTPPGRAVISGWISRSWDQLSCQTVANGFKKCSILPSEECIASASLISLLEQWSLVSSRAVDSDDDFDRNSENEAFV